jgi:serine/threonine-protein kinase HipA
MIASVRLHGLPVGVLASEDGQSFEFSYSPEWVERHRAKPYGLIISLNLPLIDDTYGDDVAGPYFRGLLPESAQTRRSLAEYLEIAEDDDFDLLLALGKDCAGAVSIVSPDTPVAEDGRDRLQYNILFDDDLSDLIDTLAERPLFVDAAGQHRSLLSGEHSKAAILRIDGETALPREAGLTSHILKANANGDHVKVEHFCLQIAEALGFDVPLMILGEVEAKPYLITPRYDRQVSGGSFGPRIRRIHQEDFCQALGVLPAKKQERHGGPGWAAYFALMDRLEHPQEARASLLRIVIFHFLIGNPEAHGKNHSILHAPGGLRLGKLYGLTNEAAFRGRLAIFPHRMALAIGGQWDFRHITTKDWEAFSDEICLDRPAVLTQVGDMAREISAKLFELRRLQAGTIGDTPLLDVVCSDILSRCSLFLDISG